MKVFKRMYHSVLRSSTYQECFGVYSSGNPVRERIVPFLHYAVVFLKLVSIIVFQVTKDREDANIERELRRRRRRRELRGRP